MLRCWWHLVPYRTLAGGTGRHHSSCSPETPESSALPSQQVRRNDPGSTFVFTVTESSEKRITGDRHRRDCAFLPHPFVDSSPVQRSARRSVSAFPVPDGEGNEPGSCRRPALRQRVWHAPDRTAAFWKPAAFLCSGLITQIGTRLLGATGPYRPVSSFLRRNGRHVKLRSQNCPNVWNCRKFKTCTRNCNLFRCAGNTTDRFL